MITDTVVEELTRRFEQVKDHAPVEWLKNHWVQIGLAVAVGYALGRTRSRVSLGPFTTTVATAAVGQLVRAAIDHHKKSLVSSPAN